MKNKKYEKDFIDLDEPLENEIVREKDISAEHSVALFWGRFTNMHSNMPVSALRRLLERNKKVVLIDVREPIDFLRGHIKGAVNIPTGLIEREVPLIAGVEDRIVVCSKRHSGESAVAADKLITLGYSDVYKLGGGVEAWDEAGYELVVGFIPDVFKEAA